MTVPLPRYDRPYRSAVQATEWLPFVIRAIETHEELAEVIALRKRAYGRHLGDLPASWSDPEPDDLRPDAVLLAARCKETGELLGSVRLICNARTPLPLEASVALPRRLQGQHLLEASRLAIVPGVKGVRLVHAIVKACFEMAYHCGQDFVVVTARRPVDRMYLGLQFDDMLDGDTFVYSDILEVPHGLFAMDILDAESRWQAIQHPLYDFMARTHHPDIALDARRIYQRLTGTAPVDLRAPSALAHRVAHGSSLTLPHPAVAG